MTNEMALEYIPYIKGIAKKFEGYKNKDDLIQVGFLGLIMAKKNYKEELNVKFSTYAYKYIYGEMCKLVREDKGIKISKNIIKLKNKIEEAKNILSQKLNRMPTVEELAYFLEMKIEDINQIDISIQSLDSPINTDCKVIFDHNIVVSNSFSDGNLYSRKKTKLKKKNNFLSYLDSFLCF